MHAELREKVISLVKRTDAEITCDSVMRYGTRIVGAEATADAIIALLRDALLSGVAVEAAMKALDDHAFSSENVVARQALTAALAKIGAPNVAR